MDTFAAKFIKDFEMAGVSLKKGQIVFLTESEYKDAYYIEVNGVRLDGLITNSYGDVFEFAREQKKAI